MTPTPEDVTALRAAAKAMNEGRAAEAWNLIGPLVERAPDFAEARYIEGLLRHGGGDFAGAERALELAPAFDAARHNYAGVLYRANRPVEAIAQVDTNHNGIGTGLPLSSVIPQPVRYNTQISSWPNWPSLKRSHRSNRSRFERVSVAIDTPSQSCCRNRFALRWSEVSDPIVD